MSGSEKGRFFNGIFPENYNKRFIAKNSRYKHSRAKLNMP